MNWPCQDFIKSWQGKFTFKCVPVHQENEEAVCMGPLHFTWSLQMCSSSKWSEVEPLELLAKGEEPFCLPPLVRVPCIVHLTMALLQLFKLLPLQRLIPQPPSPLWNHHHKYHTTTTTTITPPPPLEPPPQRIHFDITTLQKSEFPTLQQQSPTLLLHHHHHHHFTTLTISTTY